jgi:hypothetical protein
MFIINSRHAQRHIRQKQTDATQSDLVPSFLSLGFSSCVRPIHLQRLFITSLFMSPKPVSSLNLTLLILSSQVNPSILLRSLPSNTLSILNTRSQSGKKMLNIMPLWQVSNDRSNQRSTMLTPTFLLCGH